ncbi:MAG: DUF4143 domain-containing protein [Mycoplasmataceae bacterium]|nr:DUF4143 domain-containing protein [Mycoplasmataceae bacterium]
MYINRLAEENIRNKLRFNGAVNIVGAKGVGKTEIGKYLTKSKIMLKEGSQIVELVRINNNIALDGKYPRLIDEWQEHPYLWNAVKTMVDEQQKFGMFILTGSSTPNPKYTKMLHSGATRIIDVRLKTLSLTEMGLSENKINFLDLMKGRLVKPSESKMQLKQYAQIIVKGGWPSVFSLDENDSLTKMIDYVDKMQKIDLRTIASPPNPKRMEKLLLSLSRNIATQVNLAKLTKESNLGSPRTVRKYLDQLSQIFILEELESWNKHIRSSVRLLETPKWYFIDSSIATATMRINSNKLINESNTFGLFFESLVIKELRIYADLVGGDVYFYKDTTGLEIDAIIELQNGDFMIFDIKIGSQEGIESGFSNINRFKEKLEKNKLKNLISMNIITAGQIAYSKDGINVFPLAQLYFKK